MKERCKHRNNRSQSTVLKSDCTTNQSWKGPGKPCKETRRAQENGRLCIGDWYTTETTRIYSGISRYRI